MGKINGCLKCLFVFFNVLFALVGFLLIFSAVKASAYNHQMAAFGGPSLAWSWVLAIGVLGISCLGIYAGCSEEPLALKIFAGFMGIGMIIMLIFGIVVVVMRNKINDNFDDIAAEVAKSFKEDDDLKAIVEALQFTVHCCGVVGVEDWGNEIPATCSCNVHYGVQAQCKSRPQGTSGPDQIYKQGCSEFMFGILDLIFQVTMGLFFAFAVTALLGLLISILMIHQVKRHDNAGGASIAMKGY